MNSRPTAKGQLGRDGDRGLAVRWWVTLLLLIGSPVWAADASRDWRSAINPKANAVPIGKVEWTRLQTPSPYWNRHSETDRNMLDFLSRNTPLRVERDWQSTKPDDQEALCRYPFVYAHDLTALRPEQAANVAEYLKRGGFILVDYCRNPNINPAPDVFLSRQYTILKQQLPELRMVVLRPEHEVFSVYFKMVHTPPQTSGGGSLLRDPALPIRALYLDDRIVGMVDLNAYQCAWSGVGPRDNAVECMQMMANIYIYAMTH